jgi:hypothetical protein
MNFPKIPTALASSRDCFSFLVLVFTLICLHGGVAPDASAAGNVIKVTEGDRISADIVDFPLTQVLGNLSQHLPIEIKGRPDGNDRLTLHFSHLTLQEALRKIMAGYNYVVIEPGPAGGRLVITILGKAARTVREATVPSPPAAGSPPVADTPAAAKTPAAPPAASPAQLPTDRPVPPPPLNEGQPPIAAANPVRSADTAATAPGTATTATPPGVLPAPDDQPEFNPAAWGGRGYRK